MPHDVFISHSGQDAEVAKFVCHELELNGLLCWISSRDIPPGTNFSQAIVDAIEQCRAIVVILSTSANNSRYVQAEVVKAFGLGKDIFTLRIEDIAPAKGLDLHLASDQWADGFPPPPDKGTIARMAQSLLVGLRPNNTAEAYFVSPNADLDVNPAPPPDVSNTNHTDSIDHDVDSREIDENVQFTIYRPNSVAPRNWYCLLAFAHLSKLPDDAPADAVDPVAEMTRQAESILGSQASQYGNLTTDSSSGVPRGDEITFVPELEGFEFNPPIQRVRWVENLHRVEFRMRTCTLAVGTVASGRVSVYVGAIIAADIPIRIKVERKASPAASATNYDRSSARRYRRVFASYSHRDTAVVEDIELKVGSIGYKYLRDARDLRAGELWDARIKELINASDVFQLFWSTNSMISPFVRQEWEYALSLNRQDFVRPVYWETQFPARPPDLPSPELKRLHFQHLASAGASSMYPAEGTAQRSKASYSRVGLAVTCGFVLILALSSKFLPHRTAAPTHKPPGISTNDTTDRAELVAIPGGTYILGDGDQAENPRHTVTLSPYRIYKNLVTVGMYKRFCDRPQNRRSMPPGPPFDRQWANLDHPMVNVTWKDADDYCRWAGGHLPTEAQWEFAARGPVRNNFPWGKDFDATKVWCSRAHDGDASGTTAVGRYGISAYSGCSDMAGNTWEWCQEAGAPPEAGSQPTEPQPERGGSWGLTVADQKCFRSSNRSHLPPDTRDDGLGFRCVIDGK